MGIGAEAGFGKLQRANNEIDHFLGQTGNRGRLQHFDRMATVGEIGPAKRVAERLGPEQRPRLTPSPQGRATLSIDRGPPLGREAFHDVEQVGFDILQFLFPEHSFEDIEAIFPIGIKNVGVDPAIGVKTNRTTIIKRIGPFLSLTQIRLHGRLSGPIIARYHIARRLHVFLRSLHRSLNMRFSVPIQPWLDRRLTSLSQSRFIGIVSQFGKITALFILFALLNPLEARAVETAPPLSDREIIERLTKVETKIDANTAAVAQLRQDMNAQFDRLSQLMLGILGAFTALVAVTIGFALWDRRTMIRPFESKVQAMERRISP